MMLELLLKRMAERGVGEGVRERVAKLNPRGIEDGSRPRGYHLRDNVRWNKGWVGKGEFIRKHGRAAWSAMPMTDRRRSGRREYITWEVECDCTWLPVQRVQSNLVRATSGDPVA